MLVTATCGSRLVFIAPVLVLVLTLLVKTSHQSPAKNQPMVRLLKTPVHKLDDDAIWELASFLANYTSLPEEDEVKLLDISIREHASGPGEAESTIITKEAVPVKVNNPNKQDQLRLTIERVSSKNAGGRTASDKVITTKLHLDPSGLGPGQKKDHQDHQDEQKDDGRSGKRSPRSAADPFYFLHHLRPDLPALDRILAEEPPEEEPEPSSTSPAPPTHPPQAVSEDQRLQTLLRAMVVYGEAAEGDEGTFSAVQRLVSEGVARVEPPTFREELGKIVEDKSLIKTRRRREALGPDMTRFTDFMGRERYSQELINSFQPGGKRHLSIKKELREPIDVDLKGIAVMSASLRKRSAPGGEPSAAAPEELPDGLNVDGIGVDLSHRTGRSTDTDASATSDRVEHYSPATYDRRAGSTSAVRRRRSAGGTRRVLDNIRIAPDLPDLMELDPEDVLESDQSPLLPVLVSSGEEDPLAVTERAALVFEDNGKRETWSQWGRWGPCSVTCGPGQKARYRHCVQGPRCQPGERESDFKPCFRKSCTLPVPDGLVDAYRR